MRQDMSKVIVERPRKGGNYSRKGRRPIDTDLEILQEGMQRPYHRGYNTKQLNENLAPLLRFLCSRVGADWNDVYSEICQNIRTTNTVQNHVRQHVKDFVGIRTWLDDTGQIWVNTYRPKKLQDCSYLRLYVHPQTGQLAYNPFFVNRSVVARQAKQQRAEKLLTTSRSYSDGTELRKKNGIWYEVQVEPVPAARQLLRRDINGQEYFVSVGGSAYDVILDQTVYSTPRLAGPYATYYCKSKRQLNSRELHNRGLSND